jgi:gliding motility-associated-like protein
MNKIIVILLLTISNSCFAQNLANNPSFEIHDTCPNDLGEISYAINWSSSVEWEYSSDYYNTCMFDNTIINACPSCVLEVITRHQPRTGFAYAGLLTFVKDDFVNNYREALTVKIKNKLLPNQCYKINFFITFFGYWMDNFYKHVNCSINSIGAIATSDSILYQSPEIPANLYNRTPQLLVREPLKDSINWVEISGDFIADGTEQWLTIANFLPDDSLEIIIDSAHVNYIIDNDIRSYYLIDDVSIYPCDAPVYMANAGNDTCIKPGNSVIIGTARHNEYLYWWYDMQGNLLDTTAILTVSPTQTTTYILVQKDFKFDETRDTVTVSVDAHCYEVVIPDLRIPNVISPNGDGINDKFVIENGKYYNLKLSIFNRWGNRIFDSNNYQNNWPATDIADGVYFYTLTSTNPKEEVKEYKGSVSVVR